MTEVKAKLSYLRMSPRKVRIVAKAIKGLKVDQAERELMFRHKRAAKILLKLLKSAINNAFQKGLNREKLYIKNILVNKGPTLKRFYFKAGGRIGRIEKKTTHLEIILSEVKNGS